MDLLVILGFIGISQCLYLLFVSWNLEFPLRTKILLNILVGSHIILLLTAIFHEKDWYSIFPHFLYIRVPIPLLIGPSLYFLYSYIFINKKSKRNNIFYHYLPFLFYVVLLSPYYLKSAAEKLNNGIIEQPDLLIDFFIVEHFKIVHLLAYVIWVVAINYKAYNKNMHQYLLEPYKNLFLLIFLLYTIIVILSIGKIILLNFEIDFFYGSEIINALITSLLACSIAYVFTKHEKNGKRYIGKGPRLIPKISKMKFGKLKNCWKKRKYIWTVI